MKSRLGKRSGLHVGMPKVKAQLPAGFQIGLEVYLKKKSSQYGLVRPTKLDIMKHP